MEIIQGRVDLKRGVADDNRQGAILTKIAQGDLVRVPLSSSNSTVFQGSGVASLTTGTTTNPDGAGQSLSMSVPPGMAQAATYRQTVYGRVVGIRWRRDSGATNAPFSLVIDGEVFPVRNISYRYHASLLAGVTDHECLAVVADDLLSDGPHTVEIQMASDPYGGTTKSVIIYGWLLERSKGYFDYPRAAALPATTTLPTTATAIPAAGYTSKLGFYNADPSNPRTVTLTNGSTVYRTITLAALGYAEHDFGRATLLTSAAKWNVDSGTTVVGTVQQTDPR